MQTSFHVVVAGGGFGGVKTALELANKPGIKVTLIAPTSNFEYHGALYRSATGRSPLEVAIRLHDILGHAKNVEIVLDSVQQLDAQRKIVVSPDGNMYSFDALVLALGNQVNFFGIEGMAEHAATMITVPAAIDVRNRIVSLAKGPIKRPKIAVVGAGPTGTELSADIQTFAEMVAGKYQLPVKHFDVVLVEGGQRVLPLLDERVSIKALRRLKALGIHVMLQARVTGCVAEGLVLGDQLLQADLVVWTAGSKPVDFFSRHPDVFQLERGRVIVDEYLQANGQRDIFVIGDNAATKYTGMAQTALHDATFVAHNFIRRAQHQPLVAYRARHPIYVVPIGPKWAILQTDKGIVSGYRGWLVRRRADLWIFKNFEPYKKAIKQWRKGNRLAQF